MSKVISETYIESLSNKEALDNTKNWQSKAERILSKELSSKKKKSTVADRLLRYRKDKSLDKAPVVVKKVKVMMQENDESSDFSMSQCKKVSLPPTNQQIDGEKLKECLARGSYELYKHVKKGKIPIFNCP